MGVLNPLKVCFNPLQMERGMVEQKNKEKAAVIDTVSRNCNI